jgi:flagellar protein FlaI
VTRPSFTDDDGGDVDEFDLLEAALRQRPDYIVMGEIRGEEGRTLFQVMSTGHTTYTTFHADSVGEVLKRFTTDPINVSKTMFTALDLVSIQTSTRVQGDKVRRNKSLTEINHYDAENDEINVQDVYQWQAEGDEFLKMGSSNTLEDIKFDRGWSNADLDEELFKRRVVLAYLIDRGLNTYTQVAATLQAFINDEETILALMARDELERSLEDLREMESVKIDVDPEKEEMVPRPTPGEEVREVCSEILERAEAELWDDYRDLEDVAVADALVDVESAPDVAATGGDHHELDALEDRTDPPALDDDSDPSALDDDSDPPALDDGTGPSADPAEADPVEDTVEPAGTADGDGDDDAVAWEAVDGEEDGDEVDLFERLDGKSTDERTTAEEFGAGGEAEDDATDAESDGEVGIEELLDAGDEGDDGGTTWDGSGFEPVDPNDDDGDGDQAASDGGVATRSGDEPDSDTDEWFDGDGDGGDASGGDR